MKCIECPDYEDCRRKNDLRRKRGKCIIAKSKYVPTNADRMNAMSIEEKAAFIVDEVLDIHHEGMRETAYGGWLKWLQQPCGGADHAD